jgi:hypothetical protein
MLKLPLPASTHQASLPSLCQWNGVSKENNTYDNEFVSLFLSLSPLPSNKAVDPMESSPTQSSAKRVDLHADDERVFSRWGKLGSFKSPKPSKVNPAIEIATSKPGHEGPSERSTSPMLARTTAETRSPAQVASTVSKVTPFSSDDVVPSDQPAQTWRDKSIDDFGTLVTTAIKMKNWSVYIWQGFLLLCVTSTFAVLETSNPILLGVCVLVGISIASVEAYELYGNVGMVLALVFFAVAAREMYVFSKKIDMMEVWSGMFEQADVEIGLKELKKQQLEIDEAMGSDQREKKDIETVCGGVVFHLQQS